MLLFEDAVETTNIVSAVCFTNLRNLRYGKSKDQISKKASNIFHNIMKASVSKPVNPSYCFALPNGTRV